MRTKEQIAEYQREYKKKNKQKLIDYKKDWYKENKERLSTGFCVYSHTNSKGQMYIGCGRSTRPNQINKSVRSKTWVEAFLNDCKVDIIKEFETKEDARAYEVDLIKSIGLDNLINQRI